MIDPNEITGFIMSCTNVDYLRVIHQAIDQRLGVLISRKAKEDLLARKGSSKPPEKRQERGGRNPPPAL